MMSKYYPISLDIQKKPCLVVGGGKVAERKIFSLLEYEAKVSVVSPGITAAIAALVQEKKISYEPRKFKTEDLENISLVISATDDEQVNIRVAQEAQKRKILINVVDVPAESTFIVPAVIKRGDLTISISTGGKSPALAREIKKKIQGLYGSEYGDLTEILGNIRHTVLDKISDIAERKKIFHTLAASEELLATIRDFGKEVAEEKIKDCVIVNCKF